MTCFTLFKIRGVIFIFLFSTRFADAFNFLIGLSEKNHIWCGSWDIMGPYLELFYNYFKDECHDSPLRLLWKRISGELQHCIQCVSQHHQAQEMYSTEYESGVIGPLLDVLRSLDEERVTKYLREINARLARQEYDPQIDNNKVICIMYEVVRSIDFYFVCSIFHIFQYLVNSPWFMFSIYLITGLDVPCPIG